MTDNEILNKAQNFLRRSSDWYENIQNRIDDDYSMYSGSFWTETRQKEWKRVNRPCETWSIWKMYCNAISSPFNQSPYHIEIEDKSNPEITKVQDAIDRFEADQDVRSNFVEWVHNAASLGQSCLVVSFEDPIEGSSWAEPKIELVDDMRQVALDPSITKSDASDAEEGAIVNYIGLEQAKRLYGNDIVTLDFPNALPMMCDIGKQWAMRKDMIQFVNYYFKSEDGYVMFCQLCGNKLIKQPVKLPITTIPIVRTTGYKIRTNEKKTDYIGVVRSTYSLQLGANIGYSTLLERLNRSPKSNFLMPVGAMENLEEYYRRLNQDESVVTLYNGNVAPTPIVEQFQTADLRETIAQSTQLMSQTLGIPATGVEGINFTDKTATEVIAQQTNAISNVGCFYTAAYKAIRVVGKILMENFGVPGITFKLMKGPDVITKAMRQRQELTMIGGMLPEAMKPLLAKYMSETINDEMGKKLSADITANMPPNINLVAEQPDADPNAIHVLNQMKATMDQMMGELTKLKQENMDLTNQNQAMSLQLMNAKSQRDLDWRKFQVSEQNKMAVETAKLESEGIKLNNEAKADADKAMLEGEKLELERRKTVNDSIKSSIQAEKLQFDAKKAEMDVLEKGMPYEV